MRKKNITIISIIQFFKLLKCFNDKSNIILKYIKFSLVRRVIGGFGDTLEMVYSLWCLLTKLYIIVILPLSPLSRIIRLR